MRNFLAIFDLSNLITARNGVVGLVSGTVGTALSKVYGGEMYIWFILALVLAITFDWVGGSLASKKDGTYASAYGLQGILRTAVLLALPAWGSVMGEIFQLPILFFFFWGGVLFHTCISMSANFKRIGWNIWIPTWAIDFVASEIEAKLKRSESRLPIPVPSAVEEQAAALEQRGDDPDGNQGPSEV